MVADKDAGALQSDLLGPSDAPLRLAVSVAVRFETVETVGVSKELECATENVRRPNEEQLKHFSDRVAYGPWPHLICFQGLACEVGSPARRQTTQGRARRRLAAGGNHVLRPCWLVLPRRLPQSTDHMARSAAAFSISGWYRGPARPPAAA